MTDALTQLRTALEKRDQEAWLEATLRVNKEGYDTEQISEALEETLKDDPVGTSRFMEDIHRAPQAMMVISMEDDVEDWEMQCHFPQITFQKSMEAVWKVYPRIPHEDPWADNVDKAHCEVVGPEGCMMKGMGMCSRT
mmetsp:Transcript_57886/g.124363  ORF Transcript_57886/g.124363 Transcript_57886/m.124363 type:complete len:138 (+) Transcript_57886:96-509(+)